MSEAHATSPDAACTRSAIALVDVSAVVVNHNGGDRVIRAVAALVGQRYPLSQVVVVDNASSDGSPGRISAAFPEVRIIDLGGNRGLSVARNAGLRAVSSRLVLLVDHDIYVEDTAVAAMVDAWQAERAAVVCPRVRLVPERDVVQAEGAAPYFLGTMALRHAYSPVAALDRQRMYVGGCIGACYLG